MAQVLRRLEPVVDPALLVGTGTGDDAAVYRIDDATALVFTIDFFTPIVDDAFDWGRIAATNAVSDVYAMGGRPILCLNIAGWPVGTLPLDVLSRVLEGGASVARDAGALLAGGHTIDDREPKYGMAVVGLVHPDRLMRNDAARAGDVLVLTKPIGTGVISTAIKRGTASEASASAAIAAMTTLNDRASRAAGAAGLVAATDVTGFGLLGHLHQMLLSSGVSATIDASAVPLLVDAAELAAAGSIPGGTERNIEFVGEWVSYDDAVPEPVRVLLADAQTSGGMLLSCRPASLGELESALAKEGQPHWTIGTVRDEKPGTIRVSGS